MKECREYEFIFLDATTHLYEVVSVSPYVLFFFFFWTMNMADVMSDDEKAASDVFSFSV